MGQEMMVPFQELTVYQIAFEASMKLYWLLPKMLVEDQDTLCPKLVEASQLVCTNLAEAWGKRRYHEAFMAKLSDAETKAAAVQTWLAFAVECGYIQAEEGLAHSDCYGGILAGIGELIENAEAWLVEEIPV
ncbi:MAG: four helix bundle protein [Leptolyngbya sp. SIO3F4]|nr:four helix bundle protein [Leptolyngbya sp. SIO3F4]